MSKKIIGVTVGTQLPKPNFKQTDPTKGDYIKNKPDFEGLKSKVDDIDANLDNKADLVDGKIPTSQLPDNIGGLTEVYWEDIKDKPFYKISSKYEWNGDIEGRETFNVAGAFNFYQVSTEILTEEGLDGGSAKTIFEGMTFEGKIGSGHEISILPSANGNLIGLFYISEESQLPIFFIVSTLGADNAMGIDFNFTSTGVYFIRGEGENDYTHYIEVVQLKKIDAEFLPDGIGGGVTSWNDLKDKPFGELGWSIEWDGTPTDEYVDVSDTMGAIVYKVGSPKTVDEIVGATCRFNVTPDGSNWENMEYVISPTDIVDIGDGKCFIVFYESSLGILISVLEAGTYNFMGLDFEFSSEGTWFVNASNYIPTYLGNLAIKQIDKKYLPEGMGGFNAGDCPYYSGGYMIDSNGAIVNYYQYLDDYMANGAPNADKIAFNIPDDCKCFSISFGAMSKTSNDDIAITIITDGANMTGINVTLQGVKELKNTAWYTIYCMYSEASSSWVGYLTNSASDTSGLENTVDYLQEQLNNKQTVNNLVTSVNNRSSDSEYPSAKLLYDTKVGLETQITGVETNIGNALNDKVSQSTLNATVNSLTTEINKKVNQTAFDATTNSLTTEIGKKVNQTTFNNAVIDITAVIEKKANQAALDTAVDNLTTEIDKKANSDNVYSKSEIDGLISGAFHYKGSVETFSELPESAEIGDVYNVKAADAANDVKAGDNVVWCEIGGVGHWDVLSGIVDLSAYWTGEEVQGKLDEKVDADDNARLMTNAEGVKLSSIEENANNYTLPAATISKLGGVKVGANLSVSEDGTISATSLDWNNIDGKPELYTKSEMDEFLNTKQDKSNLVTSINQYSTDTQYPSAKAVYDLIGDCNIVIDAINALVGGENV